MSQPTLASTLIFWALALIPGLLHPLLLWIYNIRFGERKSLVARLLERSGTGDGSVPVRREGLKQKQEWEGRLDLGLRTFVPPVCLSALISVAASVVILAAHLPNNDLRLPKALLDFAKLATPAAIAGFAGAYVWGIYDFVDRFRTLSLPVGALHMIWFRLLLGPILGGYSAELLNKDFAPVFSFALASIPVASLLKWMQDTASQKFSIGSQSSNVPPRWELVQGLTQDIVARLNEVGVSSVAHLANQDPVNLLRLTNIEWRNILDMMDQAYLASYVDDAIVKLRPKGIRGSIEMAVLHDRVRKGDANAVAVIQSIAPDLGKDEASVKNLVQNLAEDPQVQRIWSLWWQPDAGDQPSDKGPPPPLRTDAAAAGGPGTGS
jgi:hypothetical protein